MHFVISEVKVQPAEYEQFKLGYGIDITDPSHERSPVAVRSVLDNVECHVYNELKSYTEEISSIKSYSAYLKGKASDPTTGIGFSAEARIYRHDTCATISEGKGNIISGVLAV